MKSPPRIPAKQPRILVCPDSFKGTLSAVEAARAMARGILRSMPRAGVFTLPLADGGEGSVAALANGTGRSTTRLTVRGPLGKPAGASLLFLPGATAVIEMAQAAGLLLVPPSRKKPLHASTYGVGQMIYAAIQRGAKKIIVFTGGSATTDGGAGMVQALGARLVDRKGKAIPPGGAGLLQLAHIDDSPLRRRLAGISVLGATDVLNPLLGPRGSAVNFAPQKGASPREVEILEKGLANLARVIKRDMGISVNDIPGAGSAGGTGAGLASFLKARLVPGAPLVFDILKLNRHMAGASLAITGEGSLDRQTSMGKLIAQLCRRARRHQVPVIAIAGRITLSRAGGTRMGLVHAYSLSDLAGEKAAMRFAGGLLEVTAGWAVHRFING